MQLSLNKDQLDFIWKASEWILFPALGWYFKSLVHRLKLILNEIVTDNVNRCIRETKSYTDMKFHDHETNAFERLIIIERTLTELINVLQKDPESGDGIKLFDPTKFNKKGHS